MKDKLKSKETLYGLILLILILVVGFIFSYIYRYNVNVKKILSTKYKSITCINKDCEGLIAEFEEKDKIKVKVLDSEGKIVGNYSYDSKDEKVKKPLYLAKNYLIMKKEIKKGKAEYSINSKSAKEKYKTNNDLTHISNYVVLETKKAKIDYTYNIINYEGKILIKDITDYESYKDGLVFYGAKDGKHIIFNSKGKKILNGYKVEEETDEYLIVKNVNNNLYYYFDIDSLNIKNEGFSNYLKYNDNTLEIVRKVNNTKEVSIIKPNGNESSKKSGKFIYEYRKEIKEKLGKNYKLYEETVADENTNKVFVDNLLDNSFGIYDLKEKNYDQLYSYVTNASYSEVYKLVSKDNNAYFQIVCNKPYCNENKMYVFDSNKSIIFKTEGEEKLAEEFNYYSNGYKVIKYTKKSSEDYKNKYVVYDKNDKEIIKNENPISILNTNLLVGMDYEKSLLYNVKNKKIINDEKNLAIKKDNKYYMYSNVVLDLNGNELYKTKKGYSLLYYNNFAYSANDKYIKLYDFDAKKVYTYKMNSNETRTLQNKESMIPFKSVIFINNDKKNYLKVINVKSNRVKKIKNEQIFSITTNEDNTKLYLITTKTINKQIKYGLYILD